MKLYKTLLTAAIVAALGFGMGSCADNIDNSTKPSDNPQEQQAAEAKAAKAGKYWAIVSHLVDVDDYTDDYEDKTFEPVYGVSQGNDGIRYVYTNTPASAAARFADLVDVKEGIDENTQSYTYEDADVGTLIYKKGTGRVLAEVDVDIKQIPGLKKIVYVPGAYANGTFTGRAYYRFGDVVSRQVEGYDGPVTEYWICVRPSFGREGKGDSHWVCLNVLPKKNIELYHSNTNGRDYYLPKGLGTNEVHMQNLAEMLCAIYNPEQWQANVSDVANTELKMFEDFDKGKYRLHNQYFWKNVQSLWREKQILQKAFNFSGSEADFSRLIFGNEDQDCGLHLLYKGYSWYQTFSWNCSLYEATFKNGANNSQKNMHQATTRELTQNMKEIDLDCRKMGMDNAPRYSAFFNGGNYRWTVRHATGKELAANGQYDVKTAIDGVTEVYRYYSDAYPTDDLDNGSEETPAPKTINKDQVELGYILAESGSFYRNCADANESHDKPVAMVVWLGDNHRVEKDKNWNGLAIALKDLKDNNNHCPKFCESAGEDALCTSNITAKEHLAKRCDGWAMTQRMKNHECHANHRHPAAEAVGAMAPVDGCSEWFIPSTGQWDLAMQGMGFETGKKIGNSWGYDTNGAQWPWEAAGAPDAAFEFGNGIHNYITCTERNEKVYYGQENLNAVTGSFYCLETNNNMIRYSSHSKNQDRYLHLRPFIAFEYGQGGFFNPEEPWAPLEEPQVKGMLGEDGRFYATGNDAFAATGYMPIAYVAYYDPHTNLEVDNQQYHGLAIALTVNNSDTSNDNKDFNGLNWNQLTEKVNTNASRLKEEVREARGLSKWFAPTKDYWQYALQQGFDCQFNENTVVEQKKGDVYTKIHDTFFSSKHNVALSYLQGYYWTATGADDEKAYYIRFIDKKSVMFDTTDKTTTELEGKGMRLRAMIAF